MATRDDEEIKKFVRELYASLAQQGGSCCPSPPEQTSSCCAPETATRQEPPSKYAESLYAKEELQTLPGSVTDVALGSGNPTSLAELKEGEVVLDLGSGGGIDCFLAAQKVGPEGKVIGVDMTPDMIQLARQNAQKMGVSNVEFRLGEIEHLPVETSSVDVIISNCVINLAPDKDSVFREASRVLKPGGRLCISDIVLLGELPEEVRQSLEQWAGCVAGALPKEVYLHKIRAAGFRVEAAADKITPVSPGEVESATKAPIMIASLTVTAFKPEDA